MSRSTNEDEEPQSKPLDRTVFFSLHTLGDKTPAIDLASLRAFLEAAALEKKRAQ